MNDKPLMNQEALEKSKNLIEVLGNRRLAPLDLLAHRDLREKLVELVLSDSPRLVDLTSSLQFSELRHALIEAKTDHLQVVVFGGGTGLSNIIGGDCRQKGWTQQPFEGLKQVFPNTTSVVCVTDDGGSTGEVLKDVPVIGVGDIRHVLLSSIQSELIQKRYDLTTTEAVSLAGRLSQLFNFRYTGHPVSVAAFFSRAGVGPDAFPEPIRRYLEAGLHFCFEDPICQQTMARSHCLGNLLVLSAICRDFPAGLLAADPQAVVRSYGDRIYRGLETCAEILGAARRAVMPCTSTPARLRFLYGDGVEVTGEKKSGEARRGVPVERVCVDFCGQPYVPMSLVALIEAADILVMAPGSLYSSIIPVMQVPGIADAIRRNRRALKLLIANLWVQDGETDRSNLDPERKFHVSDMIRAYDRNLPGGVQGLFDQVLCLSLQDIPGSIIQNYAVEGKSPIYLDREVLLQQGFNVVECGFYSRSALHERRVIQHDPHVVAQTVKTLYLAEQLSGPVSRTGQPAEKAEGIGCGGHRHVLFPSVKYRRIHDRLFALPIRQRPIDDESLDDKRVRGELVEIVWYHQDIPLVHLDTVRGITCVRPDEWRRDQRWDNVFSYYEPDDGHLYIRRDRLRDTRHLEVAFLIALGQSLLGTYAREKRIEPLYSDGVEIGRVYHLHLRKEAERTCYFNDDALREFLSLARMQEIDRHHFTRVINSGEGFTPPGLLMGLMYAWYLDNRLASHIEYKMSIIKIRQSDLIPEQIRMKQRRVHLTDFFRRSVFGDTETEEPDISR